jgi:hypothetical protein
MLQRFITFKKSYDSFMRKVLCNILSECCVGMELGRLLKKESECNLLQISGWQIFVLLDFMLSPCYECRMLSSGSLPGVCRLNSWSAVFRIIEYVLQFPPHIGELFLSSNLRRVLNVVWFLLGDYPVAVV